MEELIRVENVTHVIDATHPYALEVTKNVRRACARAGVKLLRVTRAKTPLFGDVTAVATPEEAAALLDDGDEKVLLAVGSKELPAFAGVSRAKERLFARVLPTSDVIAQCEALGYDAGHLIAMQGPFSAAMNEQMLEATGAAVLVTKDGGASGGTEEKLRAAQNRGARVILIGRGDEEGATVDEALLWLRREMKLECPPLFPMLLPLEGKKALLIGGGPVALRRAQTLKSCGADVRAVAVSFCEGWDGFDAVVREWRESDLDGAVLAVAATDSREQNRLIAAAAKKRGVPVSVADNAAEGSFYFPALIHCGAAAVSASTGGLDPALTRRLADRLREIWPGIVAEELHRKEENRR
ncbi:MAG: precorrin-6A/cobalt-precorrin-6A reductase [Pyramidobacter sp.]|nr:precorrin-6A/cobalt-precorrin-6A reductase [Pyramidobacter sp.]